MRNFVGAIDQGTTSTRFILFDHKGDIVGYDQKEHKQFYPAPGHVEHDPLEIWLNTIQVIQNALRISGLSEADIASVGITNQRETTILWNRNTGKPIANAIVWQDTRTSEICEQLKKAGYSEIITQKTGLPVATYFSGPKIKILLDRSPDIRIMAEKGDVLFGNIDTWLIWNLTGGVRGGKHLTDVTNASRTMLMNLRTLDWDGELLEMLNIPKPMMPKIISSSDVFGYCASVLPEVPISGVLGD